MAYILMKVFSDWVGQMAYSMINKSIKTSTKWADKGFNAYKKTEERKASHGVFYHVHATNMVGIIF